MIARNSKVNLNYLRGKTEKEATDDIVSNQLVKLEELLNEKKLLVDNIDVFCEKGRFKYLNDWK